MRKESHPKSVFTVHEETATGANGQGSPRAESPRKRRICHDVERTQKIIPVKKTVREDTEKAQGFEHWVEVESSVISEEQDPGAGTSEQKDAPVLAQRGVAEVFPAKKFGSGKKGRGGD